MPASEEIVAVIDGIPRTLDELERLAAAEQAYEQDFPAAAPASVELADEDDDAELGDAEVIALANRRGMMRDYAFTAMGAALMVLVAFLMTRVPIVNYDHANLMARGVATPALRASSIETAANDLISTLVIVPETDVQEVSARPMLKSDELEARIKDTLKLRAFTDIGVSVSKQGDAYLAGEVYSLDEARKIAHIVYQRQRREPCAFSASRGAAGGSPGVLRRDDGDGARGVGGEGAGRVDRIAGGQGGSQGGRRDQRV